MENEGTYRWLYQHSPTLLASINPEGYLVDASDAWLERLGYSRADIVGKPARDLSTPESARLIEEEYLPQFLRTGQLNDVPIQFVTADGEVVELIMSSVAEHDTSGQIVRSVSVFTELKELASIERHHRELYRLTPAIVHTLLPGGVLESVSDYWLEKLGYARDEVLGRDVTEFMSEASRARARDGRMEEAFKAGQVEELPLEFVTKDGRRIEVLTYSVADRDSKGSVKRMMTVMHDVTERNRAERERQAALEEVTRLKEQVERERDYLREEVEISLQFGEIVGDSPALKKTLARIEAVASTHASVLILGESGVGKELVARAIHSQSPRENRQLVKVNCASVPEALFESEFFGHVKGSFTGAYRDRVGRFELANGGTLFLDEVAEIPKALQAKLLRVLQEGQFERIGDEGTRTVDVRIIASTNRNLKKEIEAGRFREDLYYRLSVFPIDVPPLRERPQDIIPLATHFLAHACGEFQRQDLPLKRRHADLLQAYGWPGNVRELRNVIERAVILSPHGELRLGLALSESATPTTKETLSVQSAPDAEFLTEAECERYYRDNLIAALQAAQWRIAGKEGAANLLGLKPSTLRDRMKTLGISRPD